ncbi:hypothetical protein BMS3Abin03_02375 [bacterium BMS3Abin03]|nr:hypothetical protein BMS3Abin03_02375 [bacterium BMS3Abin03]
MKSDLSPDYTPSLLEGRGFGMRFLTLMIFSHNLSSQVLMEKILKIVAQITQISNL